MTNPTLERAARAAYEAWIDDVRDLEPVWGDLPESHRDRLMDSMKAAILSLADNAPTRAMAESVASDDEETFEPLHDIIGFNGENKTRTVLRQAWRDGVFACVEQMI